MSDINAKEAMIPTAMGERSLGLFGTIAVWICANFVITTIMTGQMFIPSLTLGNTFSVIFWGSALGCIALAGISVMTTRTGMPTLACFTPSFGYEGARLPAFIDCFAILSWGMIQGYLGAISFNYITTELLGFDSIIFAIFVVQAIVLFIVISGHHGVETLQKYMAIIMLLVATGVFYALFNEYSPDKINNLPRPETPDVPYSIAFDIVVATAFSWLSTAGTINRYCKSEQIGAAGISVGYMISTIVAMGMGGVVATLALLNGLESTYDPTHLLENSGWGVAAAFVMLISIITTNSLALYCSTMSSMIVLPSLSFLKSAFILCTATFLGALLQDVLLENFFNFVLLVGALFIPVFAIVLTDFYFVNEGDYNAEALGKSSDVYSKLNPVAIVTWIISASAVYYYTYIDPLLFGATVVGFMGTGMLYYILTMLKRKFVTVNT